MAALTEVSPTLSYCLLISSDDVSHIWAGYGPRKLRPTCYLLAFRFLFPLNLFVLGR
jgi:hypothetical protein